MYLREHTLPIIVKYNLVDTEGNKSELHPFEKEIFDAARKTAISMTENIYQNNWWKHLLGTKETTPCLQSMQSSA